MGTTGYPYATIRHVKLIHRQIETTVRRLYLFLMMLRLMPAFGWLVFITILFVLPGNEFPEETWFEKVYLDKWVHTFFFFVLVYLFYIPLRTRRTYWLPRLMWMGMAYGVAIELIQHYVAIGRSFDVLDIVFDAIGCLLAYLAGRSRLKK